MYTMYGAVFNSGFLKFLFDLNFFENILNCDILEWRIAAPLSFSIYNLPIRLIGALTIVAECKYER